MSSPEQRLSRLLRFALDGIPNDASLLDTEQFGQILTCVAWFIPTVLAEVHREWRFTGLDDVVATEARKTGEGEVRLFGFCCFVSDQTITPIYLHFQNAVENDEISWLVCKLGELENGTMVRRPFREARPMTKHCQALSCRVEQVEWAYSVTFGDFGRARET